MDLATIRKTLDLTQEALAEKIGVSPGHIGDIERRHRKLSIGVAVKLEQTFGLTGIVDAVVAEKRGEAA